MRGRFDYTNDKEYQRLSNELHDTRTQKLTLEKENQFLRSQLTSKIAVHQQKKIDMRVKRATPSDVAEAQEAIYEATVALETNIGQQQILQENINAVEKAFAAVTKRNIAHVKEQQRQSALQTIIKQRDALLQAAEGIEEGFRLYQEIKSLPQESRLQIEPYMICPSVLRDFLNVDKTLNLVKIFTGSIRFLEKKNLKKVS